MQSQRTSEVNQEWVFPFSWFFGGLVYGVDYLFG